VKRIGGRTPVTTRTAPTRKLTTWHPGPNPAIVGRLGGSAPMSPPLRKGAFPRGGRGQ